ncbi:putative Ran exchange factor Prp20/Pim1, partial [Cladorrhinum sp. PSN259]
LRIYVMGGNENGELGIGGTDGEDVITPRVVQGLVGKKVRMIAVGGMHCAALVDGEEAKENGIWTWGVNDLGALGRDTTWDGGMVDMDKDGDADMNSIGEDSDLNPLESKPGRVDFTGTGVDTRRIRQVVAGDSGTWIVTFDGDVYGWGSMRSNEGKELFAGNVRIQRKPTLISLPEKVTKLAAGSNHVVALTCSGGVYTWGFGYEQGQLGRKVMERNGKQFFGAFTPRKLGLRHIKDVFSGSDHSFAIAEDGAVYGWGLNNFGQTGVVASKNAGEDSACVMVPTKIKCSAWNKTRRVISIAPGGKHSLALTSDGECYAWGQLDGFALGFKLEELESDDNNVVRDYRGNPRILKEPTRVPGLPTNLRCAATGGSHSIAVTNEGRVYSWGFNISHQTGHAGYDDIETPRMISRKSVVNKVFVWADAGGHFTVLAEEAPDVMVSE